MLFQENSKNKFYVTTPIYYATARPHIGSLYSTLLADVLARWNKLQGKKTFFLTGTDEHGQKIAQAAQQAGKSPKEFVDSFIDAYKTVWADYGFEYNHFIRTTDDYHVKAVQEWIKELEDKGDIYKAVYSGWYCTPCETFLTEQESGGIALTSTQSPLCPSCKRSTAPLEEETYFFRLSAYQDRLLEFYKNNPDFITPSERLHEVINFVKGGLKDLSISRTTVTWGIPFPEIIDQKNGSNTKKHTAYVWADALNNYITAIGYKQKIHEEEFNVWWPADIHVIGKDIVRFHGIYWPAFLMAAGLDLPKRLLVHGWILVDKQKMSKSLGNVVDPEFLAQSYGVDSVRYYLVRQMAINSDGDFSIADLEQRISSDLANDLGNLLNRMLLLASKYELREITHSVIWSPASVDLRDESWIMLEEYEAYMNDGYFHLALAQLWKFINKVNSYFHAHEPWKLAQSDRQKFMEIISATAHSLQTIAVLLWPIMPTKMELLLESLGALDSLKNNSLEHLELGIWTKNFTLMTIPTLFEKPAEKEIKQEPESQNKIIKKQEDTRMSEQSYITIDDLVKVDLRVGTIEQAEEVPGSDKLLKLQVNLGSLGIKQIFSGVKKFYSPQDLIGKQGTFVTNLAPRKMMGMISEGMMLFTEKEDGTLSMVTVDALVPNGSRLR